MKREALQDQVSQHLFLMGGSTLMGTYILIMDSDLVSVLHIIYFVFFSYVCQSLCKCDVCHCTLSCN